MPRECSKEAKGQARGTARGSYSSPTSNRQIHREHIATPEHCLSV
jgi:hypothetical protein